MEVLNFSLPSLLQLECLPMHFLRITHEHPCARKSVHILICAFQLYETQSQVEVAYLEGWIKFVKNTVCYQALHLVLISTFSLMLVFCKLMICAIWIKHKQTWWLFNIKSAFWGKSAQLFIIIIFLSFSDKSFARCGMLALYFTSHIFFGNIFLINASSSFED